MTDVNGLVKHMGLQAGGNILSIRRLGKIAKQHNDNIPSSQRRCRPITTSNYHFKENCLARSHDLQNHKHPVYIKKFLSSADRQLEKTVLTKSYHMVTVEGKDRQAFRSRT